MQTSTSVNDYLRDHIRTVPDWPAPGVQFRDITPLLQDPKVFRIMTDAFVHRYMDPKLRPDVVAGLDARGFILGAVIAHELNVGFVPIRKKGKLPGETISHTYDLEYGTDTIEIQKDAIAPNQRVVIVDGLLATGGTLAAAVDLLTKVGAHVTGAVCIIELMALGGEYQQIHASQSRTGREEEVA